MTPLALLLAVSLLPAVSDEPGRIHGAKKMKGRLRVDDRESVFAPKKRDPRVVPGDPAASSLYTLVALPPDDPDVMPAEGDPLTAEQIATIKLWIEQGAEWPYDAAPVAESAGLGSADAFGLEPRSAEIVAAQDVALAALTARGAVAMRIAEDSGAIEVNFSLLGKEAGDADVAALQPLAADLVWLNLSRTAITAAAMPELSRLRELRRLNLANTAVDDSALAILAVPGSLPRLESLNLYGTDVTDAGVLPLAALAELRQVYLWDTAVTAEGAAALAAVRPELRIDRGEYEAPRIEPIEEGEVRAPINATCPLTSAAIDPAITSEVDGALVGFCCGNCKATFDADPAAHRAKVPGLPPAAIAVPPSPAGFEGFRGFAGTATALDGSAFDLAALDGKVVLVVAVASRSGYAPQYAGLEALRQEFGPAGFEVLGIPCDDFGGQEPGDARAIERVARTEFGTTFPLLAKSSLRAGKDRPPFVAELARHSGVEPGWNFAKYLVARDGRVLAFPPQTTPAALRERIADLLERAPGA
jgi:glutathione peroxidase-family protein